MSKFFSRRSKSKGPLPSPGYFLEWAAFLTVLFILANLAGLREFTSVLNGTIGSTSLDWQTAAFLGAVYVLIYLAFVIFVPVLIFGALILKIGRRVAAKKGVMDEPGAKIAMD